MPLEDASRYGARAGSGEEQGKISAHPGANPTMLDELARVKKLPGRRRDVGKTSPLAHQLLR